MIHDSDSHELLGGLYLDLFARAGKQGGAWLDGFQSRQVYGDELRLPVGFVIGNFAPPIGDKPSLLSFDEANTLFHEFGHALHHVLTTVDVADVSGISGVEWDAVELPSQFMENFAITDEGLRLISRHVETGDALPNDKKMHLSPPKISKLVYRRYAKWSLVCLICGCTPLKWLTSVKSLMQTSYR